MKLVPRITLPQSVENRLAKLERLLLRREAQIGGKLFGPVPQGHRREFFCLDEHTWIWHEEWLEPDRQLRTVTTRYDVRPDAILKTQNGHTTRLSSQEVLNLYNAAALYQQKVASEYQPLLQAA